MENNEQSVVAGSTFQWTLVRFIVDPLVPCETLNGDPHLWIQVNINETIGDFIKNLKATLGIQIEIGLYCQGYNLPVFSPGTWFTTLPEPIVILPAGSSNYAIEHYGTARCTTIQPINLHVSPPPSVNAMAFETPVERDVAKSVPIAFDNKGNKTDTPIIAETKNTVYETETYNSSALLMTPHRVLGVSAEFNSVNTAPLAIVPDTANAEKTSVLRNVGSSSPPVTKSSGRGKKRNSAPSRLKAIARINSPLRDGNSERATPARRSQRIQRFSLPKASSPASGIDSPVILKNKKRKYNYQDQDENIPSNNEKRRKSKTSQYNESDDSMAGSDISDEAPQKAIKRKTKAKGNRRRRQSQKRASPAATTENFPSPKEVMTKPCSVTIEKLETSFDLELKNNSIVSSTISLKTSSKQTNTLSDAFLQTSHEGMNDPVVVSFDKIASKKSETGIELSSLNVTQSVLPSIPAGLLSVADIQNIPPQGPHSLDSMAEFIVLKERQICQPSLSLLSASEPAQDYGEYENSNSGYSPCAVFDFNELISAQVEPSRNNDESCFLSSNVSSTNGTALVDEDDPMSF